jgi:hypothetical protein
MNVVYNIGVKTGNFTKVLNFGKVNSGKKVGQ